MPPMFIYPGINSNIPEEYTVGVPEGSTFVRTLKGWIDKETFFIWFKKFVDFSQASPERPVVMICDGHPSHKYNLELLEYAITHGVIIICLPPPCTHRMQPLDVTCMRSLQMAYENAVTSWLRANAPRIVTKQQVAQLFGEAFDKASLSTNAINGFRATGLFPLNPNIFTENDCCSTKVECRHKSSLRS